MLVELPVLYSFRRCPYAMRARMAVSYSAIAVELREVVLRDMPAALLACSPKGTVPVLVLPGGAVLEESRDIIDWALAASDPDGCCRSAVTVSGNSPGSWWMPVIRLSSSSSTVTSTQNAIRSIPQVITVHRGKCFLPSWSSASASMTGCAAIA